MVRGSGTFCIFSSPQYKHDTIVTEIPGSKHNTQRLVHGPIQLRLMSGVYRDFSPGAIWTDTDIYEDTRLVFILVEL